MAGTPPGLMFAAAGAALARQARREWLGSPPHRMTLKGVPSHGLAAEPRDLRPADPEVGAAVLAGDFTYAGQTLSLGKGGHPWDQASPNRRFAVALHRFEWLPHLLAQGQAGAAEALRLVLEWRRLFGKWNDFSWDAEVLERRLFNLACAIGDLSRAAGSEEAERLRGDLARQAQALAAQGEVWRDAERLAACALVYAALAGQPAELRLQPTLDRLAAALAVTVAADGGHANRSPEAAMELLLDLRALDETLASRGWPAPQALLNAIDRLTGAVRFFVLADGRLPALQGGGDSTPERAAAALAHAHPAETSAARRGGFERLESRRLQVIADAEAPAAGPWSLTACAQPAAVEILA
ncbi:MAG TPA: heparinase, partial [Phenylobacterium sp.]|nr:heparinase [Phenylobacterium sp.]